MNYNIKNAIIYNKNNINGSLIDAFEYFIAIYEQRKDIYLLFLNSDQTYINKLIEVFEDRYNLSDISDYKKNIIPLNSRTKLCYFKFDRVLLLDWGTIPYVQGILLSKKTIVISELYTERSEYFLNKDMYNSIYFAEMPFVYSDRNYRMKFLFHRFKEILNQKTGFWFLNSPGNKNIDKLIDKLKYPKIITKTNNHKQNLFQQFDRYIYYHCGEYFDPHPRLFHECYFYGKEIEYHNNLEINDGSFYRFTDLQKNGLNDRFLTKDDEIVGEFL